MKSSIQGHASTARPGEPSRLAWWASQQLSDLARRQEVHWAQWGDRWGVGLRTVEAMNACDLPRAEALHWYGTFSDAAGQEVAWLGGHPATLDAAIESALFGASVGAAEMSTSISIREAVCQRARTAFIDTLGRVCEPGAPIVFSPNCRSEGLRRHRLRWRGGVAVVVEVDGRTAVTFCWVQTTATAAGGASVRALRTDTVSLQETLVDALFERQVRLEFELHPVGVTVGELLSLRPGACLRLDHKLEDPVRVTSIAPGGGAAWSLGRALLGASRGSRAATLV